jgi:predicted dehydrogenase
MAELRAGVVGVGMMGRNHVRVLRGLEGVDLVGVADGGGDRYGVVDDLPVHASVDDLIAAGVDLCVVAVPTEDHVPIATQLADAGVHTLIEKPLAEDVSTAEQLASAFAARGLVGAVGHIERYNPALQSLRARLDADELGRPFQVATRRQGPFPNRIRDVGVVKDLATHDVDLAAWVSDATYTSISARTAHRSGREHEDLVAATGVLDDGTITNHLVNWLTPFKERVTIVTGERGCFVADTLTADLTFYANGVEPNQWEAISTFRGVSEGDMVRYAIPKPEPLAVELAAFRDAISEGHQEIVTMREGVQAVAVADALLESAAKATTVDL